MFQANSAIYIGKNFEEGYIGYFATEHLFLILSIEEGVTQEEGEELLKEIKKHLIHSHAQSLAKFESKISDLVLQLNLPSGFSLAAGLLHDSVLYLKTIGKGEIYMRRGKDLAKLISGDNSASGYVKQFDCIIFTTALFNGLIGDIEDIKTFIDLNPPEHIVDDLTVQEYDEADTGVVSLFVEFVKPETRIQEKEEADNFVETDSQLPYDRIPDAINMDAVYDQDADVIDDMEDEELGKHIRSDYRPPKQNPLIAKMEGLKEQFSHIQKPQLPKSKKITMAIVGVIFVVLIWSVVFGYQRRAEAEINKKVQTTRELVQQKVKDAEEVAFLNLERSLALMAEARTEIDKLKKDVGDKRPKDVAELEALIKSKENQIVKKEEKPYEEFYDLALENKDATGVNMYIDGDNVSILDNKKGRVYVLSLSKKSLEKRTASEASVARLVGIYKDKIYFLGGNGVHEFTSLDKVKRVIEYDNEWGDIAGLFLYNGNIYLLDKEKDEIYKYVATEKGFSSKSSYFTSGAADLEKATSIAIDSSLFISNGNKILKYTRGAPEEFKATFPTSDASITKLYTNVDIEKVYAWDKNKGVVYIVNKSGNYERQLKSDILKKASDFFATKDGIYILSGQKIYKMAL